MTTESFVRLKYTFPLDMSKLPRRVLELTHMDAFGREYMHEEDIELKTYLLLATDEVELQRGLERALIKYHNDDCL